MQISITRALSELKVLQDRINRSIIEGVFVGVTTGKGNYSTSVVGGVKTTLEAASATIQGSFDKVEDLITRRQKIKSAIILSNAKTLVNINGKEMTVAEAIEMKSTVESKKIQLQGMRNQFNAANQIINQVNTTLEAVIQQSLDKVYGTEKSKVDSTLLESIADPQRQQKEASLLDPCKIADKIEKLQNEIQILESEVDFTLSESNAKTVIEV